MLDEYWDTESYQKRFVPYYQIRTVRLLEHYRFCPNQRTNILQSWYALGEDLEREYQRRIENRYDTEDIEEDIAFYHECSSILREWIEHGTERAIPNTQ